MQCSLADFLRDGSIWGVTLGAAQSDVELLLGKPPDWSKEAASPGDAEWWCYGMFNIRFLEKRIKIFGLYWALFDSGLPQMLAIHDYFPKKHEPLDKIVAYMRDNGIDYHVVAKGREEIMVTNGNVALIGKRTLSSLICVASVGDIP